MSQTPPKHRQDFSTDDTPAKPPHPVVKRIKNDYLAQPIDDIWAFPLDVFSVPLPEVQVLPSDVDEFCRQLDKPDFSQNEWVYYQPSLNSPLVPGHILDITNCQHEILYDISLDDGRIIWGVPAYTIMRIEV